MDIKGYKQSAKLIRDNEIYRVYDWLGLKRLNVSLTELYPQKFITGHSYDNIKETYIFIDGEGAIDVEGKNIKDKSRRSCSSASRRFSSGV